MKNFKVTISTRYNISHGNCYDILEPNYVFKTRVVHYRCF